MMRSRHHVAILPTLLLAVVLVAADTMVSAHAREHDPGKGQNAVCSTCVAASVLGTACVDTGASPFLTHFAAHYSADANAGFHSEHALAARQRGPPAPL